MDKKEIKKEKQSKKILKKMKSEKEKNEKKSLSFKEKIDSFFRKIKEFCIKDTSRTIILVVILFAVYVIVNACVQRANLAQIDLTKGKLYTLTDQSKNIARSIDCDIKLYLWDWNLVGTDTVEDLLAQYNRENNKITYQHLSSTNLDDVDKIQNFGLEEGYPCIVGENTTTGKTSVVYATDLYTYDASYNMVDITEQKLTNAIYNLNTNEVTKVYFLGGNRANFTTEKGLAQLAAYLDTEYYEVDTIDPIADPTIPEDCDVLAIIGIASDLTDTETNNICQYIENGGDIIIAKDVNYLLNNGEFPNFQRVLDEYAISIPNRIVGENSSNAVAELANTEFNGLVIQANVASDNEITRILYNNNYKPILFMTGLIELDTDKMIEKRVNATPILKTSTSAVLFNCDDETYIENSEKISYTTGAMLQKTVESGDESRAVVFASSMSFSDNQILNYPMIDYTADLILNSFDFAANKGELYSIRKTTTTTTYTATEKQDTMVKTIIYAVPIAIILVGVLVWIRRRRMK